MMEDLEPWDGYDLQTSVTILERIPELTLEELEFLIRYEEAGKRRKGVLEAAREALSNTGEVEETLEDTDREENDFSDDEDPEHEPEIEFDDTGSSYDWVTPTQ